MNPSTSVLLSFSTDPDRIDRVRQIAAARQVSRSQVVREALALALAHWGEDMEVAPDPERDRDEPAGSPTSENERGAAPERTNVRWPRDARRHAARYGEPLLSPAAR
jgi:predicted transcriptional regulator